MTPRDLVRERLAAEREPELQLTHATHAATWAALAAQAGGSRDELAKAQTLAD